MATLRKRGARYQVLIRRKGHRPISKTFGERKLALAWARKTESDMELGTHLDFSEALTTTVTALLERSAIYCAPNERYLFKHFREAFGACAWRG